MAVETAYLAKYTTTDYRRDIRLIERIPVFGLVAESFVNLTANDWQQMVVTTIVPFDPEIAYNIDMTPYVTFSDNKYHQTYTSQFPVIYQS